MTDYKDMVLKYLKENYTNKKSTEFIISIDNFIKEKDNKLYLLEGIKIYKSLVDISIENEWVDDLVPSFYIHLKTTKNVEVPDVKNITLNKILKDMDKIKCPEMLMIKKIIKATFYNNKEVCKFGIENSVVEKIFEEKINCDFYAHYEYIKKYKLLKEEESDYYDKYISIAYNENHIRDVKDIDELVFKKRYS
ncbi:MAG: hypothetical protein LBU10_00600 [Endomicrobium sp.]|jgi:hypothetical protein|nr:hypothetical protein [Endomicrobium sp.]